MLWKYYLQFQNSEYSKIYMQNKHEMTLFCNKAIFFRFFAENFKESLN